MDPITGKAYSVGLRDLHFAKFTQEGGSGLYLPPKKLSEALTASITPNYSVTTLYADDRAVAVESALGDIDIQLTIADLSDSDYEMLMGAAKNSDGVIEDSVDDVAPYGALGFRIPLSGGGFRFYWYYKGRFQPPAQNHNTKGSGVEFQNPAISGKFMAREDGKWRARLTHIGTTANEVADSWFNAVYKETVTP
ncbi:major tail protein [Cytobacillus horneckiae]|uniref:major tail protein n=1 Tax=Cytobacillus horneckiae TaxID=549687 RepID=UPI003D1A8863